MTEPSGTQPTVEGRKQWPGRTRRSKNWRQYRDGLLQSGGKVMASR
ncbi:hypothetical protein OU5_1916 [Pseudomonas mandelii JR-1]|uniref:Uncharacterized protein n=1 Tax=Pseudomonas mandelii JR-1 TaxID=1147786 RepID=A0A024E8T3_9PSED|nr:hypothetical protein OU5_1916 [Pseudomonas mandelii JR-1]